jgi:hypothetical protein
MSKRDENPDKPAPVAKQVATQDEAAGEPFLKRWSRLKSGEEQEAPEAADAIGGAEEGTLAETHTGTLAETPAETLGDGETPAIDPADLPDIESLDKDSDYTVFMQEGVPDALRNLALRKLFASNPALAVLDGLNDYDEDYSKLGIVTQTVKTAYKVGRGFLEDEDLVNIDEVDETEEMDDGEDGEEVEAPAAIAEGDAPSDVPETTAAEEDRPVAANDRDEKAKS